MPKSDTLPTLMPQAESYDLKGLTLWQLYHRQEINDRNMKLLQVWLNDIQDPVTYVYWVEFDKLRKRLNRAIYLKQIKIRITERLRKWNLAS